MVAPTEKHRTNVGACIARPKNIYFTMSKSFPTKNLGRLAPSEDFYFIRLSWCGIRAVGYGGVCGGLSDTACHQQYHRVGATVAPLRVPYGAG